MPFTTVFALSPTFIIEANHDNRDVIVNLYSLSNTGAVIRCWDFDNATNDGQLTYVALGKQQWGYYEAKQNTYTLTFPISFNQRALSMCLSNSNNGKGKAVIWELGKESASIGNDTWENYWIAVGVQQWGYGTWENTKRIITVTLPISFTNTKYFSTKNVPMLETGRATEDHEICTLNQTTTTFQFYHQHNAKIGDIYQWFAIGL